MPQRLIRNRTELAENGRLLPLSLCDVNCNRIFDNAGLRFTGVILQYDDSSGGIVSPRVVNDRFLSIIHGSQSFMSLILGCACFVPAPALNKYLPVLKKKQAGFEMVGLFSQCFVLVRSDFDS